MEDLETKIKKEREHFIKKIQAGFDPATAFSAILTRIIHETQRDSIKNLNLALEQIKNLDPNIDSNEGYNSQGEAECFHKAQKIASETLQNHNNNKIKKRM